MEVGDIKEKDKAIILILISAFFASLTITIIKLGGSVPVYEKSFLRNVTTIIVATIVLKRSRGVFFGHKGSRWILILRSACGTLAVWTSYYAVSHMLIANSTILTKLSPIFAIIFAAIFLKERIRPIHIVAFIIAFIGVLFVVKPGGGYAMIPSIVSIVSAIFGALVVTSIRGLKGRENPNTIVFFYAFFSMCASIPLMIYHFQMPTTYQFLILLTSGITSTITQFTMTFAYKYAPPRDISVYNYSNIIFITILGYVFWGNIPDGFAFIGYIFIIGGALLLFFLNRIEKFLNRG